MPKLPVKAPTPNPDINKNVQKIYKGQEIFEHDLFKLLPTTCIKNKSYIPFSPDTYEKEHAHHYHSVDRKGQPLKTSSPSAGHFHEMECVWEGQKLVSVKCGPPVRFKYRMQRNKEMRRVREQVAYKGKDQDGLDDIVDEHTHDVQYIRSEMLQPQSQTDHTAGQDYISRKYSGEVLRHAQSITKA